VRLTAWPRCVQRVVPDFVAQSGDPYGDGRGGESIYGQMQGRRCLCFWLFHAIGPKAHLGAATASAACAALFTGPYFDDEISAKLSHDRKGVVSMANAGSVLTRGCLRRAGDRTVSVRMWLESSSAAPHSLVAAVAGLLCLHAAATPTAVSSSSPSRSALTLTASTPCSGM